ncbi:MAG: helix-turn-helix transcriptional regulator [Dehalococcoidales bacterium]|nr:MAG: helix-turn-helix transcriptional regulator [Dehalococcoidales bacterium]
MKDRKLSNNLRRFRFNHGEITQDQLAQAIGVSRQTIVAIENGKFNPSVRLALQIAQYFNSAVEDIFLLEDKHDS